MRKQRSDSAESVIKVFAEVNTTIPLPTGVILRNDEEMTIWRQFTSTRSHADWRDFDLVLLAKVVKLESDIRKHQKTLDEMGAIIENQRGTPIENPMFRVVDTLQRQQLSIIRSMSLNQTYRDPRDINEGGFVNKKVKQTIDEMGLDNLIAMPGND